MASIKYFALCLLCLYNLASDFMRVFIWVGFNIFEGVLIVNDELRLYLSHLIASLMASLITPDYFHKHWLYPRRNQSYLNYFCVISLSSCHHWQSNCTASFSWICSGLLSALSLNSDTAKWPEDFMSLSGAKVVFSPMFYTAGTSAPIFRFKIPFTLNSRTEMYFFN